VSEFVQETTALTWRWIRRLSREPISLAFGLIQPMLFWLILFGNLFKGAAQIPGMQGPDYISFLTAGVIVMTVLNSGLAGGVDLLFDKENGFLERLMSAPISRNSLIVSRFIFVMGITSLQILIMLLVAFVLFGVHVASGFPGIVMTIIIGLLFGIGLIALSLALAFAVKSHGSFFSLLGFLSLPLIFLSSALVPRQAMPGWMSFLAEFNPMTYTIDVVRSLILGGWNWSEVIQVTAVLLFFDAVCFWIAGRAFRKNLG
jgi:ABC-2 type transport system permease protein